jgi:ribonuclease BN (tRNA processing enzyme)
MDRQVRLQFLGSGDNFGSGGRFQTCIHVDSGSDRFLIDIGASSLIAMNRFGVRTRDVDFILLTHLHGDHFAGLPFLILESQLISRRTKPLKIAGPPGLETRILDTMEVLYPGSSRVAQKFPLEYIEYIDRIAMNLGAVVVTPHPVVHASGAPAYALRIECSDKVIAYSGDTEWTDSLIAAASGADVFICEAYFYEKKIKYHMDYRTLMAHHLKIGCKRLILTHMNTDMLRRLADIDVETAEDGKSITV